MIIICLNVLFLILMNRKTFFKHHYRANLPSAHTISLIIRTLKKKRICRTRLVPRTLDGKQPQLLEGGVRLRAKKFYPLPTQESQTLVERLPHTHTPTQNEQRSMMLVERVRIKKKSTCLGVFANVFDGNGTRVHMISCL